MWNEAELSDGEPISRQDYAVVGLTRKAAAEVCDLYTDIKDIAAAFLDGLDKAHLKILDLFSVACATSVTTTADARNDAGSSTAIWRASSRVDDITNGNNFSGGDGESKISSPVATNIKQMRRRLKKNKIIKDMAQTDEDDYEYLRQTTRTSTAADDADIDGEFRWQMRDGMVDADGSAGRVYSAGEADNIRAPSPIKNGSIKDKNKHISHALGRLPTMHARTEMLHAHLFIPDGYKLRLLPVDSGCTVTNIDDDSIIHADHRMSASRPISVASKGSDPVYPDYEGYGSIETFTAFGSIKKLRMGRCIRAPAIKDLLSVSALAAKGHECILNEHNPRMVCKDGTVVPFYYFNGLFYMPYVTPIDRGVSSQWG